MSLPEYSRLEPPECPELMLSTNVHLCAIAREELPFALEAAQFVIDHTESMGYWSARRLARERHMERGSSRPSCTFDVSDFIWATSDEAACILASRDPILKEAVAVLGQHSELHRSSANSLEPFLRWWTLRVGAEHYKASSLMHNDRCRAVWLASCKKIQ